MRIISARRLAPKALLTALGAPKAWQSTRAIRYPDFGAVGVTAALEHGPHLRSSRRRRSDDTIPDRIDTSDEYDRGDTGIRTRHSRKF